MNSKALVLEKYNNTAYLKLSGHNNFENVSDELYKLWYGVSGILGLNQKNATEFEWQELLSKLKVEFERLKLKNVSTTAF